jgi:ribose 5-phosphate isomerase B
MGWETIDLGTNSADSVDYPDFAVAVAHKVAAGEGLGVLVCGTGIGMSIAANKVKDVRAAVCWSEETARLAKEHNNANVLCIGERMLGADVAEGILKTFLSTPFSNEERHARRVGKIDALDGGCC